MLRVFSRLYMSPGLHGATGFASKQNRNIYTTVSISLRHAGTEKHQRVVEQAAAAFIDAGHLVHHALQSLDVPAADDLILFQQLRAIAMV